MRRGEGGGSRDAGAASILFGSHQRSGQKLRPLSVPKGSGTASSSSIFRRMGGGQILHRAGAVFGKGRRVHEDGAGPGHVLQVHPLDLLRVGGAAVRQHHGVVLQGDGVVAGGADAVGGGGSGEDHRPHVQPPQDQVQLRLEEGAPPGLDDGVVPRLGPQALRRLGAVGAGGGGLTGPAAGHPAGVAGQLHIAAVGAVDALDEEHGDALGPGQLHRPDAAGHRGLGEADPVPALRMDKAVLHIDDQKGGAGWDSVSSAGPPVRVFERRGYGRRCGRSENPGRPAVPPRPAGSSSSRASSGTGRGCPPGRGG